MIVVRIVALWVVCGWLTYGRFFAHFQRGWPKLAERDRATDAKNAMVFAMSGPLGLLVSLALGRHGFMWRTPK